jgi:serine/threonine-protein phosphatase 6 regulatory ankyrin repeat subunit B
MEAAGRGHIAALKALLDLNAEPAIVARDNASALRLAAEGGWVDVLRLLLPKVGDDEKAATGALIAAVRKGHVEAVRLLLDKSAADINGHRSRSVPLSVAAIHNRIAVVHTLLARNADVNKRDSRNQTALASAILNGNLDIARLLVESGAIEVGVKEANLIVEATRGNVIAISRLLDVGADINATDRQGRTALMWAAAKGHEEAVRLLVRRGADVAAKSRTARTALMEACRAGHVGVVKILLESLDAEDEEGEEERHKVIDARDTNGNTPLKEAWMGGHREILEMLAEYGAEEGEQEAKMLEAADKCRVGVIEQLIKHRVSVETTDRTERTPLMLATRSGCDEGVKVLLEAGARVNPKSKSGETPLILAARRGYKRVVDILLKANADCDLATRRGRTALMEAASSGHKDVVQALIQAGAEVNLKSNFGKTALILAVGKGHRKIIDALLKAKADCNLATLGGRTALMEAARSGCSEGARGLIEAKADVDFKSNSGETALFFAAKGGHQGIVDMLLEAGADCNIATRQDRTALMETAEAGREDIVGTLVAAEADVNQSDATGTTALMIAVRKGYRSIVEFLVGLDETRLDIADKNGRTALTLSHLGDEPTGVNAIDLPKAGAEFPDAIRQKASSMTLLLLSHGAREGWDGAELILAARAGASRRVQQLVRDDTVHVRDLEGRTGLLIACSKGDFESVEALLKAKANPGIQSHDGRTSRPPGEGARLRWPSYSCRLSRGWNSRKHVSF